MCISPVTISNKISYKLIKDKSAPPHMTVPCGECFECLAAKRNEWTFRIHQEYKKADSAYFVTLTYQQTPKKLDTQTGELIETLNRKDFTNFMKRLRKRQKPKIRFFACGEYGERLDRPHYHAILFNLQKHVIQNIEPIWKHGLIHTGKVNGGSIRYITRYLLKPWDPKTNQDKPFHTMSRMPGIGYQYTDIAINYHRSNKSLIVINDVGKKQPLPRFYRDKMFTKAEVRDITEGNIKQRDKKSLDEIYHYSKKGQNYYRLAIDSTNNKINQFARAINKKNNKL